MKCKVVKIEGNQEYVCFVDSRGVIIKCVPDNEVLLWKPLREIFDVYKEQVKFTNLREEDLLITNTDKFNKMIEKNKSLTYLKQKFDLI